MKKQAKNTRDVPAQATLHKSPLLAFKSGTTIQFGGGGGGGNGGTNGSVHIETINGKTQNGVLIRK